jgi:hypothetical protein
LKDTKKIKLPGDREMSEKCRDFAQKNMTNVVRLSKQNYNLDIKKYLAACYMCGYIRYSHTIDSINCPALADFSDSMFIEDPELTRFSYGLYQMLGGKLD